jgi:hypothetical protein
MQNFQPTILKNKDSYMIYESKTKNIERVKRNKHLNYGRVTNAILLLPGVVQPAQFIGDTDGGGDVY